MRRIFTIAAVLGAALWLGGSPAMSVPVPAGEVPVIGSGGVRTVSIAGRRVVVEVAARRNFSLLGGPMARMQASVFLAAADGRGLPGITSVKVTYTRGTAGWTPVLAKLPSDVPTYRYYVGQNGPTWPVNSTVTATVEIRTAASATRFSVPVVITASKMHVPMPGIILGS